MKSKVYKIENSYSVFTTRTGKETWEVGSPKKQFLVCIIHRELGKNFKKQSHFPFREYTLSVVRTNRENKQFFQCC